MAGHPLLPPPEGEVSQTAFLAQADDMIEAHMVLLSINPTPTPQLATTLGIAVHNAALAQGQAPGDYTRLLTTMVATLMNKLAAERWAARK